MWHSILLPLQAHARIAPERRGMRAGEAGSEGASSSARQVLGSWILLHAVLLGLVVHTPLDGACNIYVWPSWLWGGTC